MSFGAGPNSKPVPTIWTRGWPSMRMADSGVGEPGPGGKTDDRRLFANAEIMTLIKALGLATGPLHPPTRTRTANWSSAVGGTPSVIRAPCLRWRECLYIPILSLRPVTWDLSTQ